MALRSLEWLCTVWVILLPQLDGALIPPGHVVGGPASRVGSRVTALTYQLTLNEVIAGGVDGRMVFLQSSNLQSIATVDENTGGSQVNAIVYVSYSDDVAFFEIASGSVLRLIDRSTCQRCAPGEEPDAASALCVACAPGRAGANGTCSFCPMGTVQSPDRSMCIFCSEGFIAFQAACSICPDGSQPSSNRSVCVPCPPGFAGTEGLCSLCPEGTGASVDHASCETCLEGFYGSEGLCGQCPNGTRPRNRTEEVNSSDFCEPCPDFFAGAFGTCARCPDGLQPIPERSSCESFG
eukprot:g11598.t1